MMVLKKNLHILLRTLNLNMYIWMNPYTKQMYPLQLAAYQSFMIHASQAASFIITNFQIMYNCLSQGVGVGNPPTSFPHQGVAPGNTGG